MNKKENSARSCPCCGNEGFVYESKEIKTGEIERYRKCKFCGTRWVTMEKYFRKVGEKN